MPVWISKYTKGTSAFFSQLKTSAKKAAHIEDENWVFGVDATSSIHITDAVSIATQFYKVRPDYFLHNIYIKNLNIENEKNVIDIEMLVRLNKNLYKRVRIYP